MAKNFQFLVTKPSSGWSAATLVNANNSSVVGPVNAAAQTPVTAESLRTTPSTLADVSLGSRKYVNPNTGIRDVAASGSVYNQADVPAFLSQAVTALNTEQALRRSLQAEWNNRLLAGMGGPNAYLYAEALRAASVNPGASVAFGQQIADPNKGLADYTAAQSIANLNAQKAAAVASANSLAYRMGKYQSGNQVQPWKSAREMIEESNQRAAESEQARLLQPIATAAAGSGSGWFSGYR